MSTVFEQLEDSYVHERRSWTEEQLRDRVILVRNRKGLGSLAYLVNSSIPVFIPGLTIKGNVEYACASDLPELKKFLSEEALRLDGYRAQLGRNTEVTRQMQARDHGIALKLVPTTVCGMSCGYCYAGDHSKPYEKVNFDLKRLGDFLDKHGHKLSRVIVYGGDGLMQDGLPAVLGNGAKKARFNFVTGMGYPKPVFEKKALNVIGIGAHFTLSIDPLPDKPEDAYTRVYKIYPGDGGRDWYRELLARAAWISKQGGTWGARPTITGTAIDHRQLRADLEAATGGPIHMNMEPATDGAYEDSPDDPKLLRKIDALMELDVQDIIEGRSDLRMHQHYRDPVIAMLDPNVHFSLGGCYTYFNSLSLGPRGEVSFCNEVPTYEKGERDPWLFGDVSVGVKADSYARVMEPVYHRPEKCRRCDHRFTCGTHCPIKVLRNVPEKPGGCPYSRLTGEKILEILANVEDPETTFNSAIPARVATLTRWVSTPVLTADDIREHGRWLLS